MLRRLRRPLAILALLGAAVAPAPAAPQLSTAVGSAQNPPSVRWRSLTTEAATVIYPEEIEADARRVAALLETLHPRLGLTMGGPARRIPVVLHNRTTSANGFVTLFPRRTEWFGSPPQGGELLGANDWYDLLAIHEYRHVAQYDRLRTGFTRLATAVFGETALGPLISISAPSWALEGDAVLIETALTASGRGRVPLFTADLRALELAGRRVPYWTAVHGSYGRWVPPGFHYSWGYETVAEARRQEGADAWDRVFARVGRTAFLPFAFPLATRRVLGASPPELYARAMDSVRARAAGRDTTLAPVPRVVSPERRHWTQATYPRWTADGALVAFRFGLDELPQFVRLDTARRAERVLFAPGPRPLDVPFDVEGNVLVWTERRPDPRFARQDYSVVLRRDLATGETRELAPRRRWFAPSLSPDAGRVAVVEFGTANRSVLLVLDARTGAELSRVPTPEGDVLQAPQWTPAGDAILFTRVRRGAGRALSVVDVASGAIRDLVPFSSASVADPVSDGRWVYFTAPWSGVEDVWAVPLAGGAPRQVTSRPVGALMPSVSPDGRTLAFVDVSAAGHRVVTMPLDSARWRPFARGRVLALDEAVEPLVRQEGGPVAIPAAGAPGARSAVPSRRYRPLAHAFDAYGISVDEGDVAGDTRLSLLSQDVLGTLGASVSAGWNRSEERPSVAAALSYGGLYPIVDLEGEIVGRRQFARRRNGSLARVDYQERNATLGVRLPLDLTRSLYRTTVRPRLQVGYSAQTAFSVDGADVDSYFRTVPVTYGVSAGRGYSWIRDLQPVWGQAMDLTYRHTPWSETNGTLSSGAVALFAPGLVRHHGVKVDLAAERRAGAYRFAFRSALPRGADAAEDDSLDRIARVGVGYTMPLLYPDLNVLGTLHVRRLRGTLFLDEARGRVDPRFATGAREVAIRRYGADLLADLRLWHMQLPFAAGLRLSYGEEGDGLGTPKLQFLLSF